MRTFIEISNFMEIGYSQNANTRYVDTAQQQNNEVAQNRGGEKLNIDKMMQYMDTHAQNKPQHMCARACSNGLDQLGLTGRTHTGHARDMGAILMELGAVPLVTPHQYYTPKKGDFVVFDANFPHLDGHVAAFDGRHWVSDFHQNSMSPYKTNSPNYTIYRFPGQ